MDPRVIRVLLVEDNPGDQRLVREMLAEAPPEQAFVVTCVERIEAALRHLHEGEAPAAILLDLSPPDATGLEGFRQLYAAAPEVPILVLTGRRDDAMALDAVRAGAQDYLLKDDLNEAWLRNAVLFAIERQGMQRQIEQMQERILGLERDRVVAETAGAAAHEIFNPLTALLGQIDLELLDTDDEGWRAVLEKIRKEAERIAEVVRRMGATNSYRSRPYVGGRQIVDFDAGGSP